MSKRGHEINLAAGVMFSPQQEEAKMQKARIQIANELTVQYMRQFDIDVSPIRRPSKVWEYQFIKDGELVARRSLQDPDFRKGGRKAAAEMLSSVLADLGIDRNVYADLPEKPDPEPTSRVDSVGSPPETRYNERVAPAPEPPLDVEIVEEVHTELGQPDEPDLPFSDSMTIRELKEWAKNNDIPVPASITRKGDILEYMANEYTDRS